MAKIHNVSAKPLLKLLENEEAVLVDVREPGEYRSESIAYAVNLPLSKVNVNDHNMPNHKGKKLVFHCKSGKRSMMACEKIISQNIDFDVWNLAGGIDAWKNEGLEIVTSGKKILPLDRQVQLVISMMILSGLLLYNYVTPYGLLLPLLAGLGLLNASLTGWCGMARLMAIMPWNK